MHILLSLLLGQVAGDTIDFSALDDAIERCQRESVLPLFATEMRRRSAFVTRTYREQAEISSERAAVAAKRRAFRESNARPVLGRVEPPKSPESDQELALAQLALEDRQKALDDLRRLEEIRQNAMDMKRQYFLAHCPPLKKKPN